MIANRNLVSVIMPTYNAERYIREAIESIISQTYSNWELLIVDDGSTDSTRKIIEEYVKADDRVRLIEGKRKGIGGALNLGMEMAEGNYIARMDADDISLPMRLEKQVEFMEGHKEVGVCATQFKEYAFHKAQQKNMCDTFTDQDIKARLIFSNALGHPTIMFRKKVFDDGWRYAENIIAEDYDLWTRMMPDIKFQCLEDVLLYYRKEDQNSSFAIDGREIVLADRMIIKACITRLFHVAPSSYKNEDFCGNGEFYFQVKDTYNYMIRQIDLLAQIYQKNKETEVLSGYTVRKSIQERWRLLLDFVEIKDDILKRREALFLRDLNGIIDGTRSLGEYKEKLREIYDYIKNIFKTFQKVALYGMGKDGEETLQRLLTLQKKQIVNCSLAALIDRNRRNISIDSQTYIVYAPEYLEKLEFNFILISSRAYHDEIRKQLIDMGVHPEKILCGNMLRVLQ